MVGVTGKRKKKLHLWNKLTERKEKDKGILTSESHDCWNHR